MLPLPTAMRLFPASMAIYGAARLLGHAALAVLADGHYMSSSPGFMKHAVIDNVSDIAGDQNVHSMIHGHTIYFFIGTEPDVLNLLNSASLMES